MSRKHPAISVHETLNRMLEVDWEQEYKGEYTCPRDDCSGGELSRYRRSSHLLCKLILKCKACQRETSLSCQVPVRFCNYLPKIECPNPSCVGIGPDGQKGWIHNSGNGNRTTLCQCHFCGIRFTEVAEYHNSWVGRQQERKPQPFEFDEDKWDLYNFYTDGESSGRRYLYFEGIQSDWYRLQVKQYIHHLLQIKAFFLRTFTGIRTALVSFGRIIEQHKLQQPSDISRGTVLAFIDSCSGLSASTLNSRVIYLKQFLEWLGLAAESLIRGRDYPKIRHSDPTWLDEPTRTAIREHLHKIPAPIARQYLVQEYIAARPGDVCKLPFDCLVEEGGKWDIKFFQQKTQREHKGIPATREIRRVIEEQQQWIREQPWGKDYPYLFCHFVSVLERSYPTFPNLRALPKPPTTEAGENPMVIIIRWLIEKEDIRDANGQRPHFTGKITRASRLQEVRAKHGMEAAQLYADHKSSTTTFQHYTPPTREQVGQVDMPFQALLLNPDNKFLPWQSLPESLMKNPEAHELDLDIAPRLVVYGHCALDPKTPCPINLYPKCYGCSTFRPSTGKLPHYERQYAGEMQRMEEAQAAGAELAFEEAQATVTAMDNWLPQLRELAYGT